MVIDLGKEDDAQLIFETLNARGTPLLPADLVKNHLFHRAQQAALPIDDLYKAHWKPFDRAHRYWRKAVGRGQQARARIDTLLSFLVRRMVCRLTPKNYNRLAIDLLKALADRRGVYDQPFERPALSHAYPKAVADVSPGARAAVAYGKN